MKFQIDFKTPDAVDESLAEHTGSDDEKAKAKQILSKYVKWGECVSIEVDTSTGKVEVMKHG